MRVTINDIKEMKQRGEKIPMLTAYDYTTARLIDEAGIPFILVGDSLGMVVLGYESTIPVTLDVMIHHTKAVVRGTKRALIVGDMPFMTYHTGISDALRNAGRLVQKAGCQAVKLEGGQNVTDIVHAVVSSGIPVMGHIGLTPQSINQLGGFKAQGRSPEAALHLVKDAQALEEAGAFSVVLESVPYELASFITSKTGIPTIGIGAGAGCDGQVQVISDILGLYPDFVPRHAKQYAKLGDAIKEAAASYAQEVKAASFPTPEHSYRIDKGIIEELDRILG